MHASNGSTELGRVVGLWRYPVKSMGPEGLSEAEVGWHGLSGDRRWAFVRDGVEQSGFPWLTLRQNQALRHYRPKFTDPGNPDTSPTVVETPSGRELAVTDPELAAELAPNGARVIRQGRGIFDTFPVSLITTQTILSLGELVGARLDIQRFRPNILVEAAGDTPFPEDAWVGTVLRIGGARIRIDKRDRRCVVITMDPTTDQRDPAILRAVAEERQGCLGVYGTTVTPGLLTLDDPVFAEPAP